MPTIAVLPAVEAAPRQQLRMVWPAALLASPAPLRLAPGYTLRTWQLGDEPGFYRVMALAGFGQWDEEKLRPSRARMLPSGWFFIVHDATGIIVTTAMATHNPTPFHPFGGELGWVAGDPDHKGHGLGHTVCAAVTNRFLSAGYQNIYLLTDDWRLPALKTYLKLGYQPFLFTPDMADRWQVICEQLAWPFTPDSWPQVESN